MKYDIPKSFNRLVKRAFRVFSMGSRVVNGTSLVFHSCCVVRKLVRASSLRGERLLSPTDLGNRAWLKTHVLIANEPARCDNKRPWHTVAARANLVLLIGFDA